MEYHRYSLALNDEEEAKYLYVKKATGFGMKKIFMQGLKKVDPALPGKSKENESSKYLLSKKAELQRQESPKSILCKRYAAGELNAEEFAQIKKDLELSQCFS